MRKWLGLLLLGGGVLWVGVVAWGIASMGPRYAGWLLLPGFTMIGLGGLHLTPDRRPLARDEARLAPRPLVTPRAPTPPEGAPPVIHVQGRAWSVSHPLRAWGAGTLPPIPMTPPHATDVVHVEVVAGVSDARVAKAVHAGCRAARRALPHRGRVHVHAELPPDLGAPRALRATLRVEAAILHEDDREACVAAFARSLRKKLG